MLSSRGQENASELDKPWRYVEAGPRGRYDPDTNPNGIITQLTSAENQLIQPEVAEFIRREVSIEQDVLGYKGISDGSSRLSEALAGLLNEYWSPNELLWGEDIKITGSATSLHDMLGFCLFEAGQGVLVSTPYYGRFEIDFGFKARAKVVSVNTRMHTCFHPSVVDDYQTAYDKALSEGIQISAVMLVNPHNPLGRCYPPETIQAIMKFCQQHRIHLISDEIYALSVFPTKNLASVPFTSVLAIKPPCIDPELLHVIYGMSKDFALPGLRLGFLITRNKPLQNSLQTILHFGSPSSTSLTIAYTLLENRAFCRNLISTSQERLAEAYAFTTEKLDEMGIEYASGIRAWFFVFMDLSPFLVKEEGDGNEEEREQELAERLFEGGLCVQPREEHALEAGWFRLVYTVERRVLAEGLKRLGTILGRV